MGKTSFVILLVYFSSISINLGSALLCYSCGAQLGYRSACEVNVSNRTVPTSYCNPGYTTCMTLFTNATITRACSLPTACSQIHNYTRCSTCTRSLCNDGFAPSYSVPVAMTTLFVILKMFV
ncbi:hypothetical protein NQ317_006611 [Molorchus minor]|uniref:Uncharacterized protein n=1 Tax=Molorchus minor TaxID=1323400 RepID=A0ABQ9JYY3_9CUCU|nr:hypothetical protein NQ317_006611 [Molorchus minor]